MSRSKVVMSTVVLAAAMLLAASLAAQQGSSLGVVKVLPDDVLYVRSSASASASIAGALPFDATGISAGERKAVGRTTWIEVSYGGFRGWASGAYLDQVAGSRNVTAEWAKRLGSTSSPEGLARRFQAALQETVAGDPSEPEMGAAGEARLIGVTKTEPRRAVVHVSGYMDDSVKGEQFVLTMRESAGTWSADTVRSSAICWRGVSGSLCI